MSVTEICNNCEHNPVCGKFQATGGHVHSCEHHKEERKGVWLNWQGEPIAADDYWRVWRCSECKHKMEFDEAVDREEFPSNFCPNCGADMRGEGDGNHLL